MCKSSRAALRGKDLAGRHVVKCIYVMYTAPYKNEMGCKGVVCTVID